MGSEIVFGSAFGKTGYFATILIALICGVLIATVESLRMAGIVIFVVIEALILFTAKSIRYTFDDEKLSVFVPFEFDVAPAHYDSVWKVVDTNRGMVMNQHGMGGDVIQIWYDHGKGHYVCISPKDKERAMAILRERCPNAEFIIDRR